MISLLLCIIGCAVGQFCISPAAFSIDFTMLIALFKNYTFVLMESMHFFYLDLYV